jgi:hypothetical protein
MKYFISFFFFYTSVFSQPYLKENGHTRHRFAQTVFGIDLQTSNGGHSAYINESGNLQTFNFAPQINPRIYISGTHFWGHAEFYFALQLPALNNPSAGNVKYRYKQMDIFGTKIYPWPVQRKKLRPFAGASVSGLSFTQYSDNNYHHGLEKTRIRFPVMAGLNYCTGSWLIDLSVAYQYNSTLDYYISPSIRTTVATPPLVFNIGIRKWLEATLGAEKDYMDGTTEKRYQILRSEKKLSSWFWGIGPSSAFFTRVSDFNSKLFPFMDKPFSTVFPEVSAGYFYEPFGIHFVSALRLNGVSQSAYGVTQRFRRASLSLECFKYLFDYHGFNPYVGACVSGEWIEFKHASDSLNFTASTGKIAPGIIFGWDILPDKIQAITLRTNLRYFPNLTVNAQGKKVFFDQLEFNFIQLVVYPQRMSRLRNRL